MTTQTQSRREHAVGGIALMLIGIFFFAVNDTMGKWLISTYSVGQVLLLRSISAIIILSPFIAKVGIGAFFNAPRPWLQVLRAAFATFEVACFYWALSGMSLADTMTFYLAGPIYVTAVSPFLLGEHVGWRRWMAVLAGFVGVMIALGPSSGAFSPHALVAIAGSLSFSIFMVCTRLVRGTSDVVLVGTQIIAALVFGAVTAPFTWVAVSWFDAGLLALLGAVAMTAFLCINRAIGMAPATPQTFGDRSFICRGCYFVYEEANGLPQQGIPPGTAFADIPSGWRCPDCGTEKSTFRPYVEKALAK